MPKASHWCAESLVKNLAACTHGPGCGNLAQLCVALGLHDHRRERKRAGSSHRPRPADDAEVPVGSTMTFGTVMQAATAFGTVQAALAWVTSNFARLSEWYAAASRVAELNMYI